jgi:hypothetical protein
VTYPGKPAPHAGIRHEFRVDTRERDGAVDRALSGLEVP